MDAGEGLQFLCGGSIVNSRYILTAAHCVQNKRIAGVRIGEYDIRYKTDCQGVAPYYVCEEHLQVNNIFKYKAFDKYTRANTYPLRTHTWARILTHTYIHKHLWIKCCYWQGNVKKWFTLSLSHSHFLSLLLFDQILLTEENISSFHAQARPEETKADETDVT